MPKDRNHVESTDFDKITKKESFGADMAQMNIQRESSLDSSGRK